MYNSTTKSHDQQVNHTNPVKTEDSLTHHYAPHGFSRYAPSQPTHTRAGTPLSQHGSTAVTPQSHPSKQHNHHRQPQPETQLYPYIIQDTHHQTIKDHMNPIQHRTTNESQIRHTHQQHDQAPIETQPPTYHPAKPTTTPHETIRPEHETSSPPSQPQSSIINNNNNPTNNTPHNPDPHHDIKTHTPRPSTHQDTHHLSQDRTTPYNATHHHRVYKQPEV